MYHVKSYNKMKYYLVFCVNFHLINARVDIITSEGRGFKPQMYENALYVKGKSIQEFEFPTKTILISKKNKCSVGPETSISPRGKGQGPTSFSERGLFFSEIGQSRSRKRTVL